MIVGTNGSGKSNISDAIRWVLGEQSTKALRCAKMEDVIFAGSDERRPLGMAQVSLTLDNSARILRVAALIYKLYLKTIVGLGKSGLIILADKHRH